jgi:NADH-quinone oxidoreductase subunit J
MNIEMFAFVVLATIALVSALLVVLRENPVGSAFSLILSFFAVAGLYALVGAHFVAALQVLVYTGAIMVLFVFVIMLLNADQPVLDFLKTSRWIKGTAAASGVLMLFVAGVALRSARNIAPTGPWSTEQLALSGGHTRILSLSMFSDHLFVFELTSFLLLSAIVATIALAKRRRS